MSGSIADMPVLGAKVCVHVVEVVLELGKVNEIELAVDEALLARKTWKSEIDQTPSPRPMRVLADMRRNCRQRKKAKKSE